MTKFLVMRVIPWEDMQSSYSPFGLRVMNCGEGFCPLFGSREEAEKFCAGHNTEIVEVSVGAKP